MVCIEEHGMMRTSAKKEDHVDPPRYYPNPVTEYFMGIDPYNDKRVEESILEVPDNKILVKGVLGIKDGIYVVNTSKGTPPVTAKSHRKAQQTKTAHNIAKQARRKEKQSSLSDILINVKAAYQPSWWIYNHFKPVLLAKRLKWDSGKREALLQKLKDKEIHIPTFVQTPRPKFGHKTYFHKGKYYSEDPLIDYPF